MKKSELKKMIKEELHKELLSERIVASGDDVLKTIHAALEKLQDSEGKPLKYKVNVKPGPGDKTLINISAFGILKF